MDVGSLIGIILGFAMVIFGIFTSGGITAFGNFIDRIINFGDGAYVRDMIHVIIEIKGVEYFPYIFNVADVSLVVGACMLMFDLLFLDKDAVFKFKKKEQVSKEDGEIVEETVEPIEDNKANLNNGEELLEKGDIS